MTDTDSDMMRRQQNMDTRQTIEGEERRRGPADLDDRDGRDRLAAAKQGLPATTNGQDAVFAQNTRGGAGGGHEADPETATRRRTGGLVRRGRSLLGN